MEKKYIFGALANTEIGWGKQLWCYHSCLASQRLTTTSLSSFQYVHRWCHSCSKEVSPLSVCLDVEMWLSVRFERWRYRLDLWQDGFISLISQSKRSKNNISAFFGGQNHSCTYLCSQHYPHFSDACVLLGAPRWDQISWLGMHLVEFHTGKVTATLCL